MVADYTWQGIVELTNANNVEFKFAANGAWTVNWGDADQVQTGVPITNVAESGAGNILVPPVLDGAYRFTFNELSRVYSLAAISTPDTDADGMDDAWEAAHGLSSKSARDAWDDADGDGLINGEEFAWNGNPDVKDTDGDGADDFAEWVAGTEMDNTNSIFTAQVESSGGDPELSWPGMTGRTYTVYYTTNMSETSFQPLDGYSNIPCLTPGQMNLSIPDLPADFLFFGIQVRK